MLLKLIISILPIVAATPLIDELAKRAANPLCPAVKNIVTKLNQQNAATAFCSKYLQIPIKTTTSTSTSYSSTTSTFLTVSTTTFTAATVTVTASTTSTETTTQTDTVTSTVSSGTTTITTTTALAQCNAPRVGNGKRAAAAALKTPSVLTAYSGGKVLSSACSCLSVPTSTSTVIKLLLSVIPTGTISTSITSTTTTPLETTVTILTTTTTSTMVETSSTTVPAMTVYVTATGPFKMVPIGNGLDGKYASIGQNVNFSKDVQDACLVHLDPDGTFRDDQGRQASANCCGTSFAVVMDGYQAGRVVCPVPVPAADGTCPLLCSMTGTVFNFNDGSDNFACGDAWNVAPSLYNGFYCDQPISVYAVSP